MTALTRLWLFFLTLCLSVGSAILNTAVAQDSTSTTPDSLNIGINDSLSGDTTRMVAEIPFSKDALEEEINCSAKDSIVYEIANKRIMLYGTAVVDYGELHLEADRVSFDWGNSLIKAYGTKDTAGNEINYPKVTDKGKEFRADSLIYNTKSRKGITYNLKTTEGNGYVHVEKGKKLENDILFAADAKYTTCDADDPHFWLHMSKAKIIPNDKVITGPAYVMVEDVPLPAILPFGFFPTSLQKATSGILFPRYGFTPLKGYNLTDGGYYFAISDKMDLALTGDIFSFGYWGVNARTRYKARYKYSGNAEINLDKNPSTVEINGEVQPIYDFRVTWDHRQDPKSIPGMTFSAKVNAGTATYGQNSGFETETRLNRNLQSSVAFSKKLGRNFNFSSSLNHNQNLATRSIRFSLPRANLSLQRQNPFEKLRNKKLEIIKNINFSHNLNFDNGINTFDTMLFNPEYEKQWNTGLKHTLPINTSFKFFKYFNVNPSFTYNGYVNFYETEKYLDTANVTQDERRSGFGYAFDYQFNTSVNTRLFGTYNFKKSKNLVALRHVIIPSLRMNYTPDFTTEAYGYYKQLEKEREDGSTEIIEYNRFEDNPLGAPIRGKVGSIGFNIGNMMELKVLDRKDTTKENATKKIKILEALSADMNYNFFADSLNLSDLNLTARTTLFKTLRLRSTARFNPYNRNDNFTKTNEFLYQASDGQQLARLEFFNLNASLNVTEKMFKQVGTRANKGGMFGPGPDAKYRNKGLPVSMNIGYDYTLRIKQEDLVATQSLRLNGQVNLTNRWSATYDMNYDMETRELGYSKFGFRRDLHCWQFSFDWTPTGANQSFYFTLRAKASELESLKLEKNQYFWD